MTIPASSLPSPELRLPPPPAAAFRPRAEAEADGGLGRAGSLEVRLAGPREVEAAQRLRFRVFFEGGAARPGLAARLARRDLDRFDAVCDHLVVVDHAAADGPATVGTYRLLRRSVAERSGGFYSAGAFDLAPLLAAHPATEFLELGRACVLPPYRSRRTVELLWQGIWAVVVRHRVGAMFGCASLPGTDLRAHAEAIAFLRDRARPPPPLLVRARPGLAAPVPAGPATDPRRAFAALPPLVKGYARLGAFFGEDAVPDPHFGTTDLFTILPVPDIPTRYRGYFGPAANRTPA